MFTSYGVISVVKANTSNYDELKVGNFFLGKEKVKQLLLIHEVGLPLLLVVVLKTCRRELCGDMLKR